MKSLRKQYSGFTILELMMTLAIVGVLAVVASGTYSGYIERTDVNKATNDISVISLQIDAAGLSNNGIFPNDLSELGLNGIEDPWGNAYVYYNIAQSGRGNGGSRKLYGQVPINSDYDLYSMGPDGQSSTPLTARASRDDIVRARNGSFIGKAEDL